MHDKLFKYMIKTSGDISFITLNYDVLLEILLQNQYNRGDGNKHVITSANMYQFPMTAIAKRQGDLLWDDDNRRHVPPIIKLHGSINWYWSGQSSSDIIYFKDYEYDYNDDKKIDAGLIPYIIPPVMDKNNFYNHLMIKALWKDARKLLMEADDIYIIGFSFPQTDLSVRFLFQSALESSGSSIHVVNKSTENDLKKNYDEIFCHRDLDYTYCGDDDVLERLGNDIGGTHV
jgi:hypothetical protein